MKKSILLILLCLLAILLTGCALDDRLETVETDSGKEIMGKWVGNTYQNDFFDFRVDVANDWNKKTETELQKESNGHKKILLLECSHKTKGNNINAYYQDFIRLGNRPEYD